MTMTSKLSYPALSYRAVQAAGQILHMVLAGDEHADQRVAGKGVVHLIGPGATGNGLHRARQAYPVQMGLHRPAARRQGVGLGLDALAVEPAWLRQYTAPGGCAPPFWHARSGAAAGHSPGRRRRPGRGRRPPRPAAGGKGRQMGDVVAAPQIVRGEIRFEVIVHQMAQIGAEHDLIGVDQVRPVGGPAATSYRALG